MPDFKLIVPARSLAMLLPLLAEDELTHVVVLNGHDGTPDRIGFRCGATEMIARLVEGAFPDYQAVIPKQSAISVTVDIAALQSASKAADVIARDNGRTLRFSLVPQQATPDGVIPSGLELVATSAEIGDHRSFVHADVAGGPLAMGLNNKYLLDALNAMPDDDERVVMEFNTAASPIVLRPAVGVNYLSLIMPMHLGK
jgi:DNA polymerase-3 subunit beta